MYAIGSCIKFTTMLGTTLPGSADHCLGDMPGMVSKKPTTAYEIFTRFAHGTPGNNCGDLIFSAHIFKCFLIVLVIFRYSKDSMTFLSTCQLNVFLSAVALCGFIQWPFVLSCRNHYTVDTVIAIWITPLLWFFVTEEVHPNDMDALKADTTVHNL